MIFSDSLDNRLSRILASSTYLQPRQLQKSEGQYEGELKDLQRNGTGIFIWQNGDVYYGSWCDDKMHGRGIFCYNTGHYLESYFYENFAQGPGCLTYPNGSLLKGNFNKGQLDGQALFYQKDKDSWTLQDFEGGKLKKVVSQDNYAGTQIGRNTDDYMIKSSTRDLFTQKATLGCVDVENATRHYGVVKDKKLEGLGLRVNRQLIESGKYVDGNLEGQGRRLDLENKTLYEGDFLAGKCYGKGKLYEWSTKTVRTGTFTNGLMMMQDSETSFSIESLNSTLPLAFLANPLNIQQFSRNFNDIFNVTDSKPLLKSIQETLSTMNSTKFIPKDPLIHNEDLPKNSLARLSLLTLRQMAATAAENTKNLENSRGYITQHLQEKLESMRSSRKHPRSSSCEKDLEPSFSRTFSADITNRRPFVSFNHGLPGYNSNVSFHYQSAKALPTLLEQPAVLPHRYSATSEISILSQKPSNRSGFVEDSIAYNRKGSNNPLETSTNSTRINTAATPATAKNAALSHFPSSAGIVTQNLLSSAVPSARTAAGRSEISKFCEQESPSLGGFESGRTDQQLKRDSRGSQSTADFRSPSVGTLVPEHVLHTPKKQDRSNPPDIRHAPVTMSEEKMLKRNSLGHKSAINLNVSHNTPPPSHEKTPYHIAQNSNAPKGYSYSQAQAAVDRSLNMSKTSQQSGSSSAKKSTPTHHKAAGRSATPNLSKDAQQVQQQSMYNLQKHLLVYVGTAPYARKSSLSTLKSENSVNVNESMNRSRRSESNMVFNAEKLEASAQKEKRARGGESPVVQVNLAGFSTQPFSHHTSQGMGTFETMESADLKNRLLRKNDLAVSTNKAHVQQNDKRSKSPLTASKANIDISVLKSGQLSAGLTSAELEDHILRNSLERTKLGIDQSPISKAGTRSFISDLSQVLAPETVQSAGLKSTSSDINKKISNEFGIGMLSTKEIFSALGKKLQNSDMSPASSAKTKENPTDLKKSKVHKAFNLAIGERTKKREDSHGGENPAHTVTFERRNKNSTPTEPSAKRRNNNIDTADKEKDRVTSGSNSEVMKTPSFSLTDQKIFKFGLPEAKPETPQKAGRYTVSSVNSSMSKVPHHRRLGSDPKIATMSPNKNPHSPYKIDSRLSRSISPNKDQHNHSFSSAQGLRHSHNHHHHHHQHDQFGSPGSSSGYYPVKRTCDPKLEVSYYDSFVSGIKAPSSCKHSPQKWSPIKYERDLSASPLKDRILCQSVGNMEPIFLQDNTNSHREKISARSNKTNHDLVKYKEDNTVSSRAGQTPTPRRDIDVFTSPVKSQASSKATSTVQFELTSSEPLTPTKLGYKHHARKSSNLSNHSAAQVISQSHTNTRPSSLQKIRNAEMSSSAASLLKDKKAVNVAGNKNNGMAVTFGKNNQAMKETGKSVPHQQQNMNHWPNQVFAEDILKRRSSAASEAKKFSFGTVNQKESRRSSIKEEWETPNQANKKKDNTKKIQKKVAEEKPLSSAFSHHQVSERNHQRQTANFGGENKLDVPKGVQITLAADKNQRRSELLKELEREHANLMHSFTGSLRSEVQKEGEFNSIRTEIHGVGLKYEQAREADIEPWSLQRQRNQAALLQNYLDVEVRGSFNGDVDRSGVSSEKYYTKYEEPEEEDDIPEEKMEGDHDNLTCDTRLQKRKLYVYN